MGSHPKEIALRKPSTPDGWSSGLANQKRSIGLLGSVQGRAPARSEPRPVQPPESGLIVSIPVLGGLHHRYERHAA